MMTSRFDDWWYSDHDRRELQPDSHFARMAWDACEEQLRGDIDALQVREQELAYRVEQLVDALRQAKMSEWMPIETAPSGVQDILVYCDDTGEQMVAFRPEGCRKGTYQFAAYNGTQIVCYPTHWMPLPPPPKSD